MEAFSESFFLISGVLQGLVQICKKYMEVNHFLFLSCEKKNYEKELLVESKQNDALIIVLVDNAQNLQLVDNAQFSSVHSYYSLGGICLSGGNYFRGKLYGEGAIFLGGNCPRTVMNMPASGSINVFFM